MAVMMNRTTITRVVAVCVMVLTASACSRGQTRSDSTGDTRSEGDLSVNEGTDYLSPKTPDGELRSPDGDSTLSFVYSDDESEVAVQIDPGLSGSEQEYVRTRDMYYAGWDDQNRAWFYSGDVGTRVYVQSDDGWESKWAIPDTDYPIPAWLCGVAGGSFERCP